MSETTAMTKAGGEYQQQQTPVVLLTRAELALALKVSVRTVDALVAIRKSRRCVYGASFCDHDFCPTFFTLHFAFCLLNSDVGPVFSAGCDAGIEGESAHQ